MAKKSFRRSVSITGELYESVKMLCEGLGRSVSGLVEEKLLEVLEAYGVKPMKKAEYRRLPDSRKKKQTGERIHSQHFTF